MIDWSAGEYEVTAKELVPVSERVVKLAGVGEDDRVLDLGCGTGNAALIAARAGAEVTAVDPTERLLSVARERFAAEDLEADFVGASAGELPFPHESFDVVLSVFAVIFADDPAQAAAEIIRVLDEEGQAIVTAWPAEGPVFSMIGVISRAVAALTPGAPAPARNDWGNVQWVTEVFEQAGGLVEAGHAEVSLETASAEAYMQRFETVHPGGLAMAKALKGAGVYDEPRAEALKVLESHNRSADALHVVNPYVIYTITK